MRYVTACEHGTWHLCLLNPADGEERRVPYRCRSWRHKGDCCRWKASQDFARIASAIETRTDWTYVVLTFDPKDWPEWKDQYRGALACWSRLRHRLTERYGKIAYVQTWERHKSKGIHVNILIGNEAIHAICENSWRQWRRKILEPHAVGSGFGKRTWCKAMRSGSGRSMAGYLTKLARELVGAGDKGQVPFDAPPHFRRLRASRGLLPAVGKTSWTGELVFSPIQTYLRDSV